MATLQRVDFDPWASGGASVVDEQPASRPQLVKVDFDPFEATTDNLTPQEIMNNGAPPSPRIIIPGTPEVPYDAELEQFLNDSANGTPPTGGPKLERVDGNPFSEPLATGPETTNKPDLTGAIVDSFRKAGKDLMTGYKAGASGMYDLGANALMLINKASDYLAEHTGIGPMSKDTALGHVESFLRDAARQVAPKAEDVPQDLSGKIYEGLGSAPAAVAEYATGIRALGPVLGFGATDALREADMGAKAALEAGAKGALAGKIFSASEKLSAPLRTAALATVGGAQAASEGGDATDIAAGAATMGILGAAGGKGEVTAKDLMNRGPSVEQVRKTYIRPKLVKVEGDPFADTAPTTKVAAVIDQAAHEAATSPLNNKPQPTAEQAKAGNYAKGHLRLHGLDISIENPKGSKRSGVDTDGTPWEVTMRSHYGDIKGVHGRDKDNLDVFLGPKAEDSNLPVFVVDQVNPKTGRFDESKVMLGFTTKEAARKGYLENYDKGWKGLGDVTEMSLDQFKAWVRSGETTEPAAKASLLGRNKPTAPGTSPGVVVQSGASLPRTEPTATPESFTIEPLHDKTLIVRGDAPAIRARLAAAGVKSKGLLNRKYGGLIFSRKLEGELRTALEMPGTSVNARNAWAPGSNYVPLIDDAAPASRQATGAKAPTKPLRREDVLIPFLKALNVPLYEGRVKGKGRLGFYMPKKESVRIRNKSDLEVAAHELAHLIDDRIPAIRQSWIKGPNAKTYREELRGVSYDKSKIYEGFAEFTRLWMTQGDKARQLAPKFTQHWESLIKGHQYGPAIKKARDGMTAWYNQEAIARAASKIGPQRPINEALNGLGDKFRQSVADDLHGILRMERDLTGKVAPVGPYETARLSRSGHSIVEGALTIGAPKVLPDGSHEFVGKGLKQILDPVAQDLDNFLLYAVGRSAKELKMQGREKLFTRGEIQAMTALEKPAFKKAFNEYQSWNKAVVDFAQAKGLINPETRKLWQRNEYLPFYRAGQSGTTKRAKGVEGNYGGIHRLTGGTGNIRDVLGNMIQNASHLITEALKNEARVRVADMADQVHGGGRFMVRIGKDNKAVKIDKEQLHRFVYEMLGINPSAARAGMVPKEMIDAAIRLENEFAKQPDFVQFWMHGQAPRGDNVIAVMRNGKAEFYEVADPLLYRAVASLNRPAKHWTVKVLNGFRRVGQSSVTLTLDFMAANLARDTIMGSIISKHGFKPFVDSIRGMKSRIAKDSVYKEFIANGGGFSSYMLDEGAFRKHLEKFYTKKGIDYKTVLDSPGKILYALETLTDAFEMSTRLGEYKRARTAGESPRSAAYSAREVSTDFAMRGDSKTLGFMYDSVMFLKAGVNGMDRLHRGVVHDPNRAQIAAKTALLALVSMGLYGLNRGNPLYEDLEDWDKDTNWHFFVPKIGVPENAPLGERYYHFRYPKIWEIGAVATVAERSLEQTLNALEKGNADAKKYAKDVLRVTTNLFKFDYIPQAFAPLYEQAINRNRFTDRPIETQGMESLAPFARSKPYGSRAIRDLGMATRDLPRSLQVNPARAEALLRGYFNTWALYGFTLADAALYDDKPTMRVDEYPVFRRFYSADPAKHTKYETMFYDMLKEATELRRTMAYMTRANRPDIAGETKQENDLQDYGQLMRANKALRTLHAEIRNTYADETMTPEQKRQRIDELTRQKNERLQAVVEDIEDNRRKRNNER